jgi:hypothetical protein
VDTSVVSAAVVCARIAIVAVQSHTTGAAAFVADVAYRAIITVIAKGGGGRENASARTVTGVCGADVVVVAGDRRAYAYACLAMVRNRAGIAVQALGVVYVFMGASIGPSTGVHGAVVSVVAGVLICEPITVVIDAVADVGCRLASRAACQAVLLANAIPLAGPGFIGGHTRGGQG